MDKSERKPSKKPKAASKTASPVANVPANPQQTRGTVDGELVGRFVVGDIGNGEAKLARATDRLRLAFELEFKDPMQTEGHAVWLDVVLGPSDWHPGAHAFEIKSLPLSGNAAVAEIALTDLRSLAHDGRLQFYARVHVGDAEYYVNKDGRPFQNFEIELPRALD